MFTCLDTDFTGYVQYLSLHTNQSYNPVQIPLFTFNGRLRYAVTDKVGCQF
jgi:hypothetical protein